MSFPTLALLLSLLYLHLLLVIGFDDDDYNIRTECLVRLFCFQEPVENGMRMVRFWVVDVPRHGLTLSAAEKDLTCRVQEIIIDTGGGTVNYRFDGIFGPVGLEKRHGDQLDACVGVVGITTQYRSDLFEVVIPWHNKPGLLGSVSREIVQDFDDLWVTLQWIFALYLKGNREALIKYTFFMFREKEGELWVHLPRVHPVFEVVFDLGQAKANFSNFQSAIQQNFETQQRSINQQSSSFIKQRIVQFSDYGLQFAYFISSNDPSFLNDRQTDTVQPNLPSKLVLLLPFQRQQQNLHSPPLLDHDSLLASSFSPTSPAVLLQGDNHLPHIPPSTSTTLPFNNQPTQFPQHHPPPYQERQHSNNVPYLPYPANPYWHRNHNGGGN